MSANNCSLAYFMTCLYSLLILQSAKGSSVKLQRLLAGGSASSDECYLHNVIKLRELWYKNQNAVVFDEQVKLFLPYNLIVQFQLRLLCLIFGCLFPIGVSLLAEFLPTPALVFMWHQLFVWAFSATFGLYSQTHLEIRFLPCPFGSVFKMLGFEN